MKPTRFLPLLSALFVATGLFLSAEETAWNPARTWVFAVGILEWKDSKSFVSFPKENRKDAQLIECFRKRGVPAGHILFLRDESATRASIHKQLASFLAKTRPGDCFFFYFAGHGGRDAKGRGHFIPYDARGDSLPGTALTHASLFDCIKRFFRGSQILLTADCCYSGGLAVEARRRGDDTALACLTSALSNAPSTGHWTFTESLIDGLAGAPHVDGDSNQRITLAELAEYTSEEMAFGEEQFAGFFTSPSFPSPFRLGPAGKRSGDRLGERLEVLSDKKWWKARIIGQDRDRLRVHYIGWDEKWDEWIHSDSPRLRAHRPTTYPVGSQVEVLWQKRWYRARILQVKRGLHQIHYPGWSKIWDEWVGATRIRPLPPDSKR